MIVGVVGLGEVGRVLAQELLSAGHRVLNFDSRPGSRAAEAAERLGIVHHSDPTLFGSQVQTVFVVVPGTGAGVVGEELVASMRPAAVYADLSAKSLELRDGLARDCELRGVSFCDGAIVDTVTWSDRPIKVLLSGPGAAAAAAALARTRFQAMIVGSRTPVSSEIKLCRSIFTKGLIALLVETLAAAQRLEIAELVIAGIDEFMAEEFPRIRELLVGSSLKHAKRRADEMESAHDLVVKVLGAAPMTDAAQTVMATLVEVARAQPLVATSSEVLAQLASSRLFEPAGRATVRPTPGLVGGPPAAPAIVTALPTSRETAHR